MATTRNPIDGQSGTTATSGTPRELGRAIRSPLSGEAYNIVSALHAKCEDLKAYRKYSRDGDQCIWKELSDRNTEAVRLLCDELERLVPDRGPGMVESGKSAR
jgi:hypothetical protein